VLPAAVAHPPVLRGHVPDEGEDQRPGQLRGGRAAAAGAAHRDAGRGRGRYVDRRVAHPGGDEQPQVRQQPEPLGGERRPLAHRDDHVERPQLGRQVRGVGDVPVKRHDVGRAE
jgi:hypothetical protein